MNTSVGILLLVLSLGQFALGTKVCLLRQTEQHKCSARAIHLDEKETSLLAPLCQPDQPVNILTTIGNKVSEQVLDCDSNNSYAWLPWNDFLAHVKPSADSSFRDGNVYVGRNILLQEDEPAQLCRIDLNSGHCVSVAGNQSQNIVGTEVLVQRLPIHLDLRTTHTSAWRNVTHGETVRLANTHLYNRETENRFVQKVIPYDLEREVHFDLPEGLPEGTQVNVYDAAGRLDLRFDVGDAATTLISKSTPAIKRMLPRTRIEVTVQGSHDRVLSNFNGDLITVFDRADDKTVVQRFTKSLLLSRIDIGVQEVQVEFGVFAKLDPNAQIEDDDSVSLEEDPQTEITEPEVPENAVLLFRSKTVYPGFQKYATIGSTIFFAVVFITFFDVIRQLRKMRRMKAEGKSYDIVPKYDPGH